MYRFRHVPLSPRVHFLIRLSKRALLVLGVIIGSLALGAIGYHLTEGWSWIDSILNASMILTGMGPVNVLQSRVGKIFATLYALFSGVVFLSAMALLLGPILHRFLHRFHLEFAEKDDEENIAQRSLSTQKKEAGNHENTKK